MSERNDAMAAMLAADAPAARDLAFEIAVLARIEQRRFRRGVMANVALAVTATILLALVMPDLENAWQAQLAGSLSNGVIAALLFALVLPLQWAMVKRT
jgi:hypothetical protein